MTHSPWQASLVEQRTAWAVAACSLILILTAASQPQWFDFSTPAQHHTQPQAKQSTTKTTLHPQTKVAKVSVKKVSHTKAVVKTKHQPSSPKIKNKPAVATKQQHAPSQASLSPLGFYVQIGAFKAQDRAHRLKNKLTKQGWHAHIMRRKSDLHAIWIGPESSHAKAATLLKNIQRKLHYKGFIVQNKRE